MPAFIEQAKARFPNVAFRVAAFDALDLPAERTAGILAWYSLIHLDPERVPAILEEFARSLQPGGSLLLGFFEGARLEQLPHAVTTAYLWPVEGMTRLFERAGFVAEELHNRVDPNTRPHAAIMARRLTADATPTPTPSPNSTASAPQADLQSDSHQSATNPIHGLEEGHPAIEAFVLIKILDDAGHTGWSYRSTNALNP